MPVRLVARRIVVSTCLAMMAGVSHAQPENITPGEVALTPDFCQDVQALTGWTKTNPSPRTPYWIGLMGETFWAMHHQCWAMIHLQRADRAGVAPHVRKFHINSAISDFYYIIKNSPPDFVMLPEIYYRIGDAHAQLGNVVPAMEHFAKSRALKPDYWPAYLGEARLAAQYGKTAQARSLLETGLRAVPGQPDMQALLKSLPAAGSSPSRAKSP